METPRDLTGTEGGSDDGKSRKSGAKIGAKSEEGSTPSEPEVPTEKELLLCLRPIRDGETGVDEKLRFGVRKKKSLKLATSPSRSDSTKPPKKRRPGSSDPLEGEPAAKKTAPEKKGKVDNEVVESLMAMNKQSLV